LPVTAQSPAQPAQQFPRAAPTEFGAQRGRLTSGDSFGAHGVGERGLKLADSMFGLIDQLCSRSSCDRSVSTAPFSASIIRETVRNCPGSAIRGAVSGTSAGSPWPDIRAGSPPRPAAPAVGLLDFRTSVRGTITRTTPLLPICRGHFRRRTRNGGDRTGNGEPAGHLT